jgi:parallel beta-helix repeat protein
VVPAGVILRGSEADKGQTVAIIGGGNFISKTFARQTTTLLASAGSEIRGVSVTNPNVRGTGIWVESVNPVIENSTFANNNREGIFITGTANPKIAKNLFTKNGGNGISAANNARGEIQENLFQDTGFGIAVSENAAPTVVSNRFTENTDGLYLNDTAKPILRNNIIENSRRDGIVATGAAAPDLGKADSLGNNILRNNRQFDLNNSTSNVIFSIGNAIDSKRVAGRVEFSGPIPDGGEGTSVFPDVQGHWAQAYIEALAKRNVISGFPGGAFRPNDPVTRVQYAAIISKAFNPAPKQPVMQFRDIDTGFWGYQPIQSVVRGGFMRGYPEGVFRPDQQIPRVQVLVALSTGLGFPAANDMNILSLYQDAAQIPSYARNAVAAATMRKIVVNYPQLRLFNPNREATRAEVAALVYQALVAAGQAPALPSPYIVSPN